MHGLRRAAAELAEGVRIAVQSLAGARLRSALTTLGIVIGVTTVIAIVAIIQGLNTSFESQIQMLGAHTLYVDKWKWLDVEGTWWMYRNRKAIGTPELKAILRDSSEATAVSPMTGTKAPVTRGDKELTGVNVNGASEQYLLTGGGSVATGRFLAEGDVEMARPVTVLGADVADVLFPGAPPEWVVGQRVLVSGHPFTVVGLMERRGRFLGVPLDNNLLVPYTTFGRVFGS